MKHADEWTDVCQFHKENITTCFVTMVPNMT